MQSIIHEDQSPCLISIEQIDDTPLLKIDFNIKNYTLTSNNWQKYDLPANTFVLDKLYFDEKLSNKLIYILESFIENGLFQCEYSHKNSIDSFYVDLNDSKGLAIALAESPVDSSILWFGIKDKPKFFIEKDGKIEEYKINDDSLYIEDRLILDVSKAQELKQAIESEWQVFKLTLSLEAKGHDKPKNKI